LELLKTFPPTSDQELERKLEAIKKEMDDLASSAPHVPSGLKRKIDDELKSREHRRIFNLPATK